MPFKKITQREARKLRKELAALKEADSVRRAQWHHDYPGGVFIQNFLVGDVEAGKIGTAAKLNHVLVAKIDNKTLNIYAVKP